MSGQVSFSFFSRQQRHAGFHLSNSSKTLPLSSLLAVLDLVHARAPKGYELLTCDPRDCFQKGTFERVNDLALYNVPKKRKKLTFEEVATV